MSDTPLKTTRLEIPYPPENGEDWWTIENAAGGRMDMLDKCIYAAMENPNLWVTQSGYWTYSGGEFTVQAGPVTVNSPAGGTIVFEDELSVTVEDGDYVYFEVPQRPVASTGLTGVLGASSTYLERPDRCLIGHRRGSNFDWLHPHMRINAL